MKAREGGGWSELQEPKGFIYQESRPKQRLDEAYNPGPKAGGHLDVIDYSPNKSETINSVGSMRISA